MTQEQLRMQMLAGIITEGQYKEMLNENTKYNELKPLEDILLEKGYTFYKDDVGITGYKDDPGYTGAATYDKGDNEIHLFKDYKEDMENKTFPIKILILRGNKILLSKNCDSIDKAKNILLSWNHSL
jgi:hypothetical protein